MDTMNYSPHTGGAGGKMWVWVVILAVIVVAVVAVWRLGLWQAVYPAQNLPQQQSVNPNAGVDTVALDAQSSSDEVSAIDADLKATDLNNLDAGVGEIKDAAIQ